MLSYLDNQENVVSIGIDPGCKGAIVMEDLRVDPDNVDRIQSFRLNQLYTSGRINPIAYLDLVARIAGCITLKGSECIVYFTSESVVPYCGNKERQIGVKSAFSLGHTDFSKTLFPQLLKSYHGLDIQHTVVKPQKWKEFAQIPKSKRNKHKNLKEACLASRASALGACPNLVNFGLIDSKYKQVDTDVCEAYLIHRYGYEQLNRVRAKQAA